MEPRLLDDRADPGERLGALRRLRQAEQRDVAGGRLRQPEQRADHRRLARAVRAEEAEGDAGRHGQIDASTAARSPKRLVSASRLDHRVHPAQATGFAGRLRSGPDDEREERRRQQVADATGAAAVRHVERGAEAVHGNEAELPGGERVPAAGDQDGAEPV